MKGKDNVQIIEETRLNQRRDNYIVRSSEKLKQIHKQRRRRNHSYLIERSENKHKQHNLTPIQKSPNIENKREQTSSESSLIILTPSRKRKNRKYPPLSFLTDDNPKSSSPPSQTNCKQKQKKIINAPNTNNKHQCLSSMVLQTNQQNLMPLINNQDAPNCINILSSENRSVRVLSSKEKVYPLKGLNTKLSLGMQDDHQICPLNMRGLNKTPPLSSIKKRLFQNETDFIDSQQENINCMVQELASSSSAINKMGRKKQHIVKVLEVVKMKNSSIKLAKVSVSIENVTQLQIKYVHTIEVRQLHPELLIKYYEDTFDSYFSEINYPS